MLPGLSSTVYLVAIFFRDYGSINPFLNDATFIQTYVNSFVQSGQRPKASRLALLNMVLAIAATSSIDAVHPVERRIWLSGKFYQRARALSLKDAWGCADLDQGELRQ